MFYVHPETLGKMIQFDEQIFQMGWFNHHLHEYGCLFFCFLLLMEKISGQIIATSHDLTPNGGLVREIPLFQGNLGW